MSANDIWELTVKIGASGLLIIIVTIAFAVLATEAQKSDLKTIQKAKVFVKIIALIISCTLVLGMFWLPLAIKVF